MNSFSKTLATLALGFTLMLPTAVSAHSITTVSASSDLRISLERLLGEHAILAVTAMQKGIDAAPDFDASAGALLGNSDDLSAAIEFVYGKDAGVAFKALWNTHIGFFVDYVKATAAKDEAGRKTALDKLDKYRFDFAEFLAGANPNLKADMLAAGLKDHVGQLVSAFDNYANKDYAKAYASVRESYTHMFHTGAALGGAITIQFPDKFKNEGTSQAAVELRSAVDRLLGEHAVLAVIAMQKGVSGAPDFNDAAGALMANSDDLSAAIESVYGKEAGAAFKGLWNTHIGFFVDYVKATAAKDEAGRKAALDKLDKYRFDFGAFMESANPNLKADVLAASLKDHVGQLVSAFDNYVNKDYSKAYASTRESYAHMFHTGDALAAAIVTQFQDKFHDKKADDASMLKVWMKINSTELKIGDKVTIMDTTPFMWESNTFLPLRYLSEGIGAEVKWEAATQTIWVKAGNDTLTFWIGKDYMEVNGMKKDIGTQVFIDKNGRTVVPLRFITELLGWDVQWNETDWSIMLTKAMSGHKH